MFVSISNFFFFNFTFTIEFTSWLNLFDFEIFWKITIDRFNILLIIMVTSIVMLIILYTLTYFKNDPFIFKFISFLILFGLFMLILISSSNLLVLLVGWEGVGLCSFSLINFWYSRVTAVKAAVKALVINRIGDIFLLCGLMFIYYCYRTLDFNSLNLLTLVFPIFFLKIWNIQILSINIICCFLLLGAIGKSAQLILHTWLPDAMEGPTPISALIHAATMVTAGILLIIKTAFFFENSQKFLIFLIFIGSFTAFAASLIALVQFDIKKIIAFSTCSQLGLMVLVCGLSSYNISCFHLLTHAIFKALLFLISGIIIHLFFNEQDTRRYGNFFFFLPLLYSSSLAGSFALIGFPFFAGFFSKDLLIENIFQYNFNFNMFFFFIIIIITVLSSVYTIRLITKTFFLLLNISYVTLFNIHNISLFYFYPLMILAILSIFIGYLTNILFTIKFNIFFQNDIFILFKTIFDFELEMKLSIFYKLIPIIFSILGCLIIYFLNKNKEKILFSYFCRFSFFNFDPNKLKYSMKNKKKFDFRAAFNKIFSFLTYFLCFFLLRFLVFIVLLLIGFIIIIISFIFIKQLLLLFGINTIVAFVSKKEILLFLSDISFGTLIFFLFNGIFFDIIFTRKTEEIYGKVIKIITVKKRKIPKENEVLTEMQTTPKENEVLTEMQTTPKENEVLTEMQTTPKENEVLTEMQTTPKGNKVLTESRGTVFVKKALSFFEKHRGKFNFGIIFILISILVILGIFFLLPNYHGKSATIPDLIANLILLIKKPIEFKLWAHIIKYPLKSALHGFFFISVISGFSYFFYRQNLPQKLFLIFVKIIGFILDCSKTIKNIMLAQLGGIFLLSIGMVFFVSFIGLLYFCELISYDILIKDLFCFLVVPVGLTIEKYFFFLIVFMILINLIVYFFFIPSRELTTLLLEALIRKEIQLFKRELTSKEMARLLCFWYFNERICNIILKITNPIYFNFFNFVLYFIEIWLNYIFLFFITIWKDFKLIISFLKKCLKLIFFFFKNFFKKSIIWGSYRFLSGRFFFDNVQNKLISIFFLSKSWLFYKLIDKGFLELYGPFGLKLFITFLCIRLKTLHAGSISKYLQLILFLYFFLILFFFFL
jgi:proton-translocating NADH-quinone oxidoreductase chain L